MEFQIIFYKDVNAKEPVKEFLDKILKKNRSLWVQTIGGLEKIKHKNYQKEPLSKTLGNSLWEIRIRSRNDILRIIYTFTKNREIILLHGFIKKTQKIPKKELNIAKQRLKEATKGKI